MDRESKINQKDLDFEKLNATLADPNFANWYYNEFMNNPNKNMELDIEDFVQTINNYKFN